MDGLISWFSGNELLVKSSAAIFLLGFLIFIHELGHFLFAKGFGVGVEKFSFGFGPRIFGFTWKGTEYRLSWIPLGGYVKMEGDDPFDESPPVSSTSLMQKAPWKRLLIAFAGPLFNLVLPMFLFAGVYLAGAPEPTAWVGLVSEDSAAARAGIQVGDRLLKVGDRPVRYFTDVRAALEALPPDASTAVEIERNGATLKVPITLKAELLPNEWGEPVLQNVLGVSPTGARPLVGVDAASTSPAYSAGVRSGDRVVAVDGAPVLWGYQLFDRLKAVTGPSVSLTLQREGKELRIDVPRLSYSLPMEALGDQPATQVELEALQALHPGAPFGLFPYELFIKEAIAGRPAFKAGLMAGDMLYSVNGRTIQKWLDLKKSIEAPADELKEIVILRQGVLKRFQVQPNVVSVPQPDGSSKQEGQIGIRPPEVYERDEVALQLGLIEALARGARETVGITVAGVKILARVVTGDIPLTESLGGPISIVTIAAQSAWVSIFQYVRVMALLSVNLGLINLLPIPLLDGGHILFHFLELVRGRPVSMRFRELSQQVGLILLFLLMAFALANDVRMNLLR